MCIRDSLKGTCPEVHGPVPGHIGVVLADKGLYHLQHAADFLGCLRMDRGRDVYKRQIPKPPKLQKIADYLDVSLSYLMTGIEETLPENQKLNERDKRDIAKDLDRIMEEIVNCLLYTSRCV